MSAVASLAVAAEDRFRLESSLDADAVVAASFDPLSDPMLHCLDVF
jgi:hypothetical protein